MSNRAKDRTVSAAQLMKAMGGMGMPVCPRHTCRSTPADAPGAAVPLGRCGWPPKVTPRSIGGELSAAGVTKLKTMREDLEKQHAAAAAAKAEAATTKVWTPHPSATRWSSTAPS